MHHIFPKALLYKASYDRSDVNALVNFTFLSKDTNLKVSDKCTSKNAQMRPNRGSGRHPASGFWRSVAPERLI